MIYEELFKKLFDKKVQYVLCGGLAVNIYGIPRMTADIDVLLDFDVNNLQNFKNALHELNYSALLPVPIEHLSEKATRLKYITEKNLIAYSFFPAAGAHMSIDVLIDCPVHFDELWTQKTARKVDDYEIYLASVDHLIEMKQYCDRMQDQQDIILLSKIKEHDGK